MNRIIIRAFDFSIALSLLIIFLAPLLVLMGLIYLQDFHNPIFAGRRLGIHGKPFSVFKLRSMLVNAESMGGSSTSSVDRRITRIGHFIRSTKLDELPQLLNVVLGQMSLVGPRPQVVSELPKYSKGEAPLLSVRPGITDLASIVFADEGDILKDYQDPDLAYDQLIRPWKSRISLLCVENLSISLYFRVLILTALSMTSREKALNAVAETLKTCGARSEIVEVAKRRSKLPQGVPPVTRDELYV